MKNALASITIQIASFVKFSKRCVLILRLFKIIDADNKLFLKTRSNFDRFDLDKAGVNYSYAVGSIHNCLWNTDNIQYINGLDFSKLCLCTFVPLRKCLYKHILFFIYKFFLKKENNLQSGQVCVTFKHQGKSFKSNDVKP